MTKNDTCKRLLAAAAVLLAAAAMLHTLFVGLEIDEEYALSLGFRLVRGDRLSYSMWEPHQLSALPPALLIAAYTAVTGTTTGVLLFVRVTMLVLKAVLSVWFYRSLRAPLGRTSACLLALVLFVFTPQVVSRAGLCQPAVPLYAGSFSVFLRLLCPRPAAVPRPVAGGGRCGLRLLQSF